MSVILASGSPRRKELMKLLFSEYEIRVSDIEEVVEEGLSPAETVMSLARQKGSAVPCDSGDLLIAADTVVAFDETILGKPRDREDAARMVGMLSGRTHCVYTGVYVRKGETEKTFYEKTEVEFYPLSDDEIEKYVLTGEADDKAGAYGIQGRGGLFVKKINGDYNNVVGFPVARIARELKDL